MVLSQQPTPAELEALLAMIGRFADATGAPATRLTVSRGDAAQLRDKDILVVGPVSMATSNRDLFSGAPIQMADGRLRLRLSSIISQVFSLFGANLEGGERKKADEVLVNPDGFTGVVSYKSPYGHDRVVVGVLSDQRDRLPALVSKIADPVENFRVQGDLVADTGAGLSSFRIGPIFWTGSMPLVVYAMWWLSRNPLMLALALVAASLILSGPIFFAFKALERRRLGRDGKS